MRLFLAAPLVLGLLTSAFAQTLNTAHVKTTYADVDKRWARALAEIAEAARVVYIEDFGFDMPTSIGLDIRRAEPPKASAVTDGHTVFVRLLSSAEIAKPPTSRTLAVCHELGHIAMNQTLSLAGWMWGDAEESWAVYIGAVVVDRVYRKRGESFWPEPYDYRKEGIPRLEQVKAYTDSPALPAWYAIGQITGDRAFAGLFRAWRTAKLDPHDPRPALGEALCGIDPRHAPQLREIWRTAGPALAAESRTEIQLSAIILDRYIGNYRLNSGGVVGVTRDGARLFVQMTAGPKREMFPEGESRFFLKYVDAQLTFEAPGEGQAASLVLHLLGQDVRARRIE